MFGYLVERGWENHETLPESLELTFLMQLSKESQRNLTKFKGNADENKQERLHFKMR